MPGFNSMTLMVSDLKKCTFISAAGKSRIAVRDASFDFICVRGFGKTDIARGDVVGSADNAPTIATEFTAQMVVLNHPTVITVGYTPVFHIHTAQVACQITAIEKKLNPATGEVVAENPDFIKNGDAAIVKVKPVQPLVIEKQKDIPQMSRFAIRDSGQTVAAGMCIDLVKK